MDAQLVISSIKNTFYDFVCANDLRQFNDVIEFIVMTLKKELQVNHVVFCSNKKDINNGTPNLNEYLYQSTIESNHAKVRIFKEACFISIYDHDNVVGFIKLNTVQMDQYSEHLLNELAMLCSNFYSHCVKISSLIEDEIRYKHLYHMTEKFHSSMNKDDVLAELVKTLQRMYPDFTFYLLVSHDNENKHNLPIKDLTFDYHEDDKWAMEAYVSGKDYLYEKKETLQTILYAPLKGKQGVYGVLQVISNESKLLEPSSAYINLLAGAAGLALENAQLYEQSNKLIKDLQLINTTSHRLNKNLKLREMMSFMSKRILESFDADEVGFYFINQDGSTQTVPGSTSFFLSEEVHVFLDYVRGRIEKDMDGLLIGDITTQIIEVPFSSVMAVPMKQSDCLKGFVLVLHQKPYHFTFDKFKLLQSLIHHSTLALTNSLLREELETLVKTDYLTQLYSRSYFNRCIENSMKIDQIGTFVLIDIDNFKIVNDTYGHQTGDLVLVQVANIIKSCIREDDIGARWGGEELAIYLPGVNLSSGIAVAERIVQQVREKTNPTVTISCGVSSWQGDNSKTFKDLFNRADQALYKAKNSGKNQVTTIIG